VNYVSYGLTLESATAAPKQKMAMVTRINNMVHLCGALLHISSLIYFQVNVYSVIIS